MTTNTFNTDDQQTNIGATFDGNGNPTAYNGMAFGWDLEDRATSLPTETLSYAPDGSRAAQTDSGSTIYYLYDGATPIAWYSTNGSVAGFADYGASGYLGQYTAGSYLSHVYDPHGNGILGLNPSENILSIQYAVSAFGSFGENTALNSGYNLQNDIYYPWNPGTNMLAMGARLYDPTTGRFLNRDPLGYGGGMNLYGYADDDPVDEDDPSGLNPWNPNDPDFGIFGGNDVLGGGANFFGGWGDSLTFGGTKIARRYIGGAAGVGDANSVIDYNSCEYNAGFLAGTANSIAIDGAGLLNGGARSVFYSGGMAARVAARTGKGAGLLLEDTLGGKILNSLDRASGGKVPIQVWQGASAIFAMNAKGTAAAFLRNPTSASVWMQVERPILRFRGINTFIHGMP